MYHQGIRNRSIKKKVNKKGRRFAALLCVCLTVMNLPGMTEVLAEGGTGLCAHHTAHTAECGYDSGTGSPCGYSCKVCAAEAGNGTAGTDVPSGGTGTESGTGMQNPGGAADTGTDAGVPGDEGGASAHADKVITDWKWVDEEQILSWNEAAGQWEALVHVPIRGDIRTSLLNLLPSEITAVLADGSSEAVNVEWNIDSSVTGQTVLVGWHAETSPAALLPAGYSMADTSRLQVHMDLYGPSKFLNDWEFTAPTEMSVIEKDDNGNWTMDIFPESASYEAVKKLLDTMLPQRISCTGSWDPNWNWPNSFPAEDYRSKGFYVENWGSGKYWGELEISWFLDNLKDMDFQYGETFTLAASYGWFWGVNNPGDQLVQGNLKLNIRVRSLELDKHIVTDGVSDPEACTVNLFDYWVEGYGAEPKEPKGDILEKSDKHFHPNPLNPSVLTDSEAAFSDVNDWNKGINREHLLIFGDGLIHAGLWNKGAGENTDYGKLYAGMENIVESLLPIDGYPVLNTAAAKEQLTGTDYTKVGDYKLAGDHDDTGGTDYTGKDIRNLSETVIGTWGKDIDKDKESLDYLFNPETAHSCKKTYQNVTGLFQVDDEGYYYYNMRENFAEFQMNDTQDGGQFVLYDAPATLRTDGTDDTEPSVGNFFPFNEAREVYNGLDEDGNLTSSVACSNNTMNHHLGMTVDIDFRQPVDGMINMGTVGRQDMTFGFSGDDDVWVFIDDVLVLDLGGVHSEIYGTINFADGDVYIGRAYGTNGVPEHPEDPNNMVIHTTLKELYEKVGKADTTAWSGDTFASNSDHKLRMFYLERGNYDSSIALRFNLQPRLYQQIKKVDHDGNPVKGVEFDLYEAEKNGDSYTKKGSALTHLVTGEDGSAAFTETDASGDVKPFNFSDRAAAAAAQGLGEVYYILEETYAPPGYRLMPEDIVLTYDVDTTLLLVVNTWSTGAYASFTESITGNSHITYGNINPANGEITSDAGSKPVSAQKQAEGLVVAVPMLQQHQSKKWQPLYGNNTTGLHTVETAGADAAGWRKAVLNAAVCQCADNRSGAIHWYMEWDPDKDRLEGHLSDLPGRADRYQLTDKNGDMKVVYAIIDPEVFQALGIQKDTAAERYAALGEYIRGQVHNGVTIDDIVDQIHGVSTGELGRGFSFLNVAQFIRDFRSSIYIPNEQRELWVWKIDQDGNGVNGVEFGLYSDPGCTGTPAAIGTTASVDGRDGVLIFSPNAGGRSGYSEIGWNNTAGTRYYLKERSVPAGYQLNRTITPIVVGTYSIYADAGTAGNGISVMAGVGKLAQTLSKYAADEEVDITLRDITAFAQTQRSGAYGQSGWSDMLLKDTQVKRSMNLHYGMNTTMHYGLHDEDGGKNLLPLFVTDTGFLRARIQQNYAALIGESYGSSTIDTNKEDLGTQDLTNLFSLLNIVVVTDRTTADTRTGELTVGKVVRGENLTEADYTRRYTFTIELTDADGNVLPGEYRFYGTDKSGSIQSGDQIPLHHDESITILGLPEGTLYRVKETMITGWYVAPPDGELSGSIVSGEESSAVFVNSNVKPGSLTLSKQVTGVGDLFQEFTFTVTLLDIDGQTPLAGSYPYTGSKAGKLVSGGRVKLKHNESITITGVPAGTKYQVTEAEADSDGYQTSSMDASGTIVSDQESTAQFTNFKDVRRGDLTIGKTVKGSTVTDEDRARLFTFTLELTDETGQALTEEFDYTGTEKNGKIKSGDTIQLHHEEHITVTGLPEGTKYLVKETLETDWFTSPESGEISGTIEGNGTAAAVFINSRTRLDIGSLTLEKTVTGVGDTQREFSFVVTLTDADGNELAGDYPYLGAFEGRIASGGEVKLKHHESITITELPAGTQYSVTELEADEDGYETSMKDASGEIEHDGEALAVITNHKEKEPEPVIPPLLEPPGTVEPKEPAAKNIVQRADGTGDRNPILIWITALWMSLGLIAADIYARRRRRA